MQVIKVTLVGDELSGKTLLAKEYTLGCLDEGVSLESNTFSRTVDMNGKLVNLHLVVTAASDEASKLRTLSYAQTDLFLFLYSVVDAQSLENLCTKWVPEVKATCLYTPFMFVGTHTELRGLEKTVSLEYATSVCKDLGGFGILECSFLQHAGVDAVFEKSLGYILDPPVSPRQGTEKKKGFWPSKSSKNPKLKKSPRGEVREGSPISTSPINAHNMLSSSQKKGAKGRTPGSEGSPDPWRNNIHDKPMSNEWADLMSARSEIAELKEQLLAKDGLIQKLEQENSRLRLVQENRRNSPSQLPRKEWSVDEVYEFMKTHPSLKGYAKLFRNEEIDGMAFLSLDDNDCKHLNLKLGPRKLVGRMIEEVARNLN